MFVIKCAGRVAVLWWDFEYIPLYAISQLFIINNKSLICTLIKIMLTLGHQLNYHEIATDILRRH